MKPITVIADFNETLVEQRTLPVHRPVQDVILAADGTLRGQIVSPQGTPLREFQILVGTSRKPLYSAKSDDQGHPPIAEDSAAGQAAHRHLLPHLLDHEVLNSLQRSDPGQEKKR